MSPGLRSLAENHELLANAIRTDRKHGPRASACPFLRDCCSCSISHDAAEVERATSALRDEIQAPSRMRRRC
eukprot:5768168-Prymnesium_polylepis.2